MFSADTPMQYAFAEHMTDPQTGCRWRRFISASAICCKVCSPTHRSGCYRAGSFFLLADYSGFSDERDSEMVKRLIVEYGLPPFRCRRFMPMARTIS